MLFLYVFLGGVVAYCLVQSLRFRLGMGNDATGSSGTDRVLASIFASTERGSEGHVKEALLTEEGRRQHYRHKAYDTVGILAALALILLWLDEKGILDRILAGL